MGNKMSEVKVQYRSARIINRGETRNQDFEVPISMETVDAKLEQNGVRNSITKRDMIHNME